MNFSFTNDNNYIRQFERIIQTQNDNSNSSSCAATSLSEGNVQHAGSLTSSGSKKRRPQLTQEQRELINAKRRISSLTPAQRELRNAKRRVTHLSGEQRERINSKRRVSALSPEQRELRNAKRRIASLTPSQREVRNQKRRNASHNTKARRPRRSAAQNGGQNNGQAIVNATNQQQQQQQHHSITLNNGHHNAVNSGDLTLAEMINLHQPTIQVTGDNSAGLLQRPPQSIITLTENGQAQSLHMLDPSSPHNYIGTAVTIKKDNGGVGGVTGVMTPQNLQATGLIFATSDATNLSYIRSDLFSHKITPYTQQEMNAIRNNTILKTIR